MIANKNLGKYHVQAVIGHGGMGVIYRAYDPDMCRTVAIKTLRTDLFDESEKQQLLVRFRGEAKAYGRLQHPNIVSCYSLEEANDLLFIVMEFVDGESLQQKLNRGIRFSLNEASKIILQLLHALEYSHNHQVIHRDIKPSNIMVLPDGRVKVADFGVAKIDTTQMTQTGHAIGSPDYMSPEQFLGKNTDNRSDLYSTGVILYQLLTGKKPFEGPDVGAVLHNVLNHDPISPSSLNRELTRCLDEVILKAIEKSPDNRYQTAKEFSDALHNALEAITHGNEDRSTTQERKWNGDATIAINRDEFGKIDKTPQSDTADIESRKGIRFPRTKWTAGISVVGLVAGLTLFMNLHDDAGTDTKNLGGNGEDKKIVIPDGLLTSAPNKIDVDILTAGYECSSIKSSIADHQVTLDGFVSSKNDADTIRKRVASLPGVQQIVFNVEVLQRPYCELLSILEPYMSSGNDQVDKFPMIKQMVNYRADEYLQLEVTAPESFSSELYVDYFLLDGTVVHLFPNEIDKDNRIAPGQHIELGNPDSQGRKWKIDAPFGKEIVTIISSKEKLFTEDRPETETAKVYLASLRHALSDIKTTDVSATYLNVVTRPRRNIDTLTSFTGNDVK